MKLSIILLACFALVAAEIYVPKNDYTVAEKDFLLKQKFILEILHHVHEPLVIEEYLKESTKFVHDKEAYVDFDEVEDFFKYWEHGYFLEKGLIFEDFHGEHTDQVKLLFNFFYYAKDWTTFYKNVIWARVHINEYMFVTALTTAVLHREDCVGIVLPAPYEIFPFMFFDSQVISKAHEFRQKYYQDKSFLKKEYPIKYWESKYFHDYETKKVNPFLKDYDMYYVWANYTGDYYKMNEETKLDYFREDIGWNSFYYYYFMDYPTWMDGEKFDLVKDHRGEQFLYIHQQLLARYYLERLSQHMGEIPEFSYYEKFPYGYDSHLMYYNGQGVSVRKNYYEFLQTYSTIQKVSDYERRIHDVIDHGFYKLQDGTKIDLTKPESVEYLGNWIEQNTDNIDSKYFGDWLFLSHWLLGGSSDFTMNGHFSYPTVMDHYSTMLRDPAYYMLYKRVIKAFTHFKKNLPYHKYEELFFKGVEIKNVDIEKIVTFEEHFDADLTTLMGHDFMFNDHDVMFKARQWRLTHKPFEFKLDIVSDKPQKVVFRVFMGPKYDEYGHLYKLTDNYENFYEIDQFWWELPTGKSVVKRHSSQFYWSVKDRTTYTELYKHVMLALDGKKEFHLDMSEAHCGFPERLLFPKGWVSGMPVQFFFMVSPYVEPSVPQYSTYDHKISCGVGSGSRFIDIHPFGYPFDREIYSEKEFYVPNMYFADTKIYYEEHYEHFDFHPSAEYHH